MTEASTSTSTARASMSSRPSKAARGGIELRRHQPIKPPTPAKQLPYPQLEAEPSDEPAAAGHGAVREVPPVAKLAAVDHRSPRLPQEN